MPQTNVISDWKLTYPADAPRMKPSGIPGTVTRAISAATASSNVATITVPSTTDYVGTVYTITVTGMTPAAYNGTWTGTIASATTITYPLGSTPGNGTVFGSVSYQGMIPTGMSTTLPATAVPNKPQWTGTQMALVGSEEWNAMMEPAPEHPLAEAVREKTAEEMAQNDEGPAREEADEEETDEEEEEPHPHPRGGRGRRR